MEVGVLDSFKSVEFALRMLFHMRVLYFKPALGI